jgi:hypothetical protein
MLKKLLFLMIFCLFVSNALAIESEDKIWREIDDTNLRNRPLERQIVPNVYRTFKIDKSNLDTLLKQAPLELSGVMRNSKTIISLPMPDGSFSRFRIQNSPIMEPELAAKYPEIQTYLGQGIDIPDATVNFDVSMNGFRAMILSSQGTMFIEPYAKGDTINYITFKKSDYIRTDKEFSCEFDNNKVWEGKTQEVFKYEDNTRLVSNGATLRTYRLAVAATAEYTTFYRQTGDTNAQAVARALAGIVTTMNRVNGVYTRDLAVRMILVANNDLIIYTDSATDPYTNTSSDLTANQTNINAVIGTANYDVGHLVGTGGGGVAQLGVPCTTSKARGLTGSSSPVGDGYDIDYVAHEMGHQFGGNHTFNGTVNNCGGGNRAASAAYEPGSGITIMAYAGICGNQDLAPHSIDTFHVKSLEEIVTFINGTGNSCAVSTATGNNLPAVPTTSATSYNVPKQTPFSLSATTTDADNDALTYDWQEYDLGASTTAVPNTDSTGVRPIFRPYLPKTNGTIYYPSLTYILNNANVPPSTFTGGCSTACLTGELMPAIARTMNFQVVARDNRAGGGGINTKTVQVVVDGVSGPFNVTAPNTAVSWTGGSSQTVTWNVAGTTATPVSAATVKISLSTDGGNTFPTVLLSSTANDGTETITVPNVNTTTARIKVEGEGKIFFDISDANFTITSTFTPNRHYYDFDGDFKDDVSVYRNGNWYLQRSTAGFLGIPFGNSTDKTVAADYDGDGKADSAIYRPSAVDNQPDFYVLLTNGFVLQGVAWGTTGDLPCVADWDGDNKADYCVWRPANADYFILYSNGNTQHYRFGLSTDKLVTGDYDGDNKADYAVFRSGIWYIQRSTAGFTSISFGLPTDIPVPSDFDGDGKTDVAVYRNGTWYILGSTVGFTAYSFGNSTDIPAPADYDGDNKSDVTVYRPSDGTWYMLRSTSGFAAIPFGLNGDKPIPAQNQ